MLPYKDANFEILNKLDDKSLGRMCQVNPEFKKLCDDDMFWKNRIISLFGEEILSIKNPLETYKRFYTSKRFGDYKNKIYPWCRDVLRVPKLSQMVIDDFYNPDKGFINWSFTRDREGIIYLLLKIVLQREDSDAIRKLITDAKNIIPDYRLEQFDPETFDLTDKEKMVFRQIIDIPVGRIEILKNAAKVRPEFVKAFSQEERPEIFKFIAFIHNGFKSGRIPFDIKWDELCTHPYLFTPLTF